MMVPQTKPIVVAAGGTGGHLFVAEALARELGSRGYRVQLITDDRADKYAATFPAEKIHVVTSGTVTGKGIAGKLFGVMSLAKGMLQCARLLKSINPAIVVGFGGYPTVPPLMAASVMKLPTAVHEANAVMGRANRFLAKRMKLIATGFPFKDAAFTAEQVHTGNPVRAAVLAAAALPLPEANPLVLCVFGGSQGARIMSDVVPAAIALLPQELRLTLKIVQQARDEDQPRVTAAYAAAGVAAEISGFFSDMPARIAASHLVIARGGASTGAELAVIGRASILVPLPGALDQDQAANAGVLVAAHGADRVMQPDFTPQRLAAMLTEKLMHPDALREQGRNAKAIGIPDAASRLADSVLKLAQF